MTPHKGPRVGVAAFVWNQWQASRGIGGSFRVWNQWQLSRGISGNFRVEYARDDLDKELERRGHRFVRNADESNISVKSLRAGQRVLASVTRCLERRLQRTVHAAKSAVDRPWRRPFLGVTFTRRRPHRRQGSAQALKALKQEGRQRTGRTRGVP